MKYNRQLLIEQMQQSPQRDCILFWSHIMTSGKMTKACFSQWFPCTFTVDGHTYCCSEQYMMAQKALLFGDQAHFEAIMASTEAREIKALGRLVTGFDAATWNDNKYRIVLEGNIAKFSQNEALKAFLLGTGDSIIAEASPYDGIWGIRMGIEDPAAHDPRSWQGENLLGFVLMETRDILREST